MQPCHQDGINGIPLQQHRRQAQGQCAPPGKALQCGAGVQDAAIDPLRLRHKGPACFGQRHAGGAALKQGQIKLLFQTADLVAEGWLGAVQLPGGCGKIQGPAHGEKTQQLVVVHPKKAPFCAGEDPSALSIAWRETVINTFY